VVATTTTDSHGHYSFTDQTGIPGTGNFSATIVLPAGYVQTTPNPPTIHLSRGGLELGKVDFGIDPSILDGRFDGQGSRADLTAAVARPMNALQGPVLAPMPRLLIGTFSQSIGLQDTSVASHPSSMQPDDSELSNSFLTPQFVAISPLPSELILQTGRVNQDNILIGGTTLWDKNVPDLMLIMHEWLRTDLNFDQRMSDLSSGGVGIANSMLTNTGVELNNTTVFADSSIDTLNEPSTNSTGRCWFFVDSDDIVPFSKHAKNGDHTTPV
jgi:hypothetical protein